MHKGISPTAQSKIDALDPGHTATTDPNSSNDNVVPGQGQSGTVGKMSNSDNSLRNMDNNPTA
jgi:hypothetical protein